MADKLKRFVIIDGKSIFYRGYYAMPELKTKEGIPTGGIYGFAVMALEVLKKLKPDYVCVAWDKPKTNIRKRLEIYSGYKAGRKPAPDDFYLQIPILHKLLDAFGWPLYELDDYEADDIMGTLSHQATAKNIETYLVTSDLDVLQLVSTHTRAYILKKGLSNIEEYNVDSFEAKHNIKVEQFLDYKSLAGDSSDNIPGVPGIGSKTATDLLGEYSTLDDIYDNLELIKSATSQKLLAGKDSAYMSRKLAQIWLDAPISLNINEVDGSRAKPEEIKKILSELEFKSLVSKLPEIFKIDSTMITSSNYDLKVPKNFVIDSDEKLTQLKVPKTNELVIYSRTKGKHGNEPLYLNISPDNKINFLLDIRKLDPKLLSVKLTDLFSNNPGVIGHDLKNTIQTVFNLGVNINNIDHDILIGAFLINSLNRALTITELAEDSLGYSSISLEDLDDDEFIQKSPDIVAVIREVAKIQKAELLNHPKISKLANDIEWKIIPVLARMEFEGISLNIDLLAKMATSFKQKIAVIQKSIFGYAGREFNINSPVQLAEVLYKELKLSTFGVKKGKNNLSTGAKELDKLRGVHPVIDLITEYREHTKLLNTYIEALPKLVDSNSRIHTSFNLTIAQTGRLSSTDPNLQNIPIKTEIGREIRSAFISKKGYSFIAADYSQFELRLAAYLSKDKELINQFNSGLDVHTVTAAQMSGQKPELVTKEMRRFAKTINFGILYGMSPHGLSVATNMTQEQSKKFIERYYELRKPLLSYMEKLLTDAKTNGFVEDLFGRRRPMPDINSPNFIIRKAAERAAINMPIQGTAADLMKLSMIAVEEKLSKYNARILIQVHDSILVECLDSEVETVKKIIKETMEKVYAIDIKLSVEVGVSKNWGNL
ncbi:MAG TPA: DNA polymerase I [Candidatus Dormibacteraeota bacterium]|nr:DNA polymerase I [Candidatus Dormibacteraeota bacterium]